MKGKIVMEEARRIEEARAFVDAMELVKSESPDVEKSKRFIVNIINDDKDKQDVCMVSGDVDAVLAMFAVTAHAIMESIVCYEAPLKETQEAIEALLNIMRTEVTKAASDVTSDLVNKAMRDPDRRDEARELMMGMMEKVINKTFGKEEKGE